MSYLIHMWMILLTDDAWWIKWLLFLLLTDQYWYFISCICIEFFKIKLKTWQTKCATINIMKKWNRTITDHYDNNLKHTWALVIYKNIFKTPNWSYFDKSSRVSKTQGRQSFSFTFDKSDISTIISIKTKLLGFWCD